MVRLEGLALSYASPGGPIPSFEGAEAEIPSGSIAAIVGPSGCGKTSIVRVVAGLRMPTAGRVVLGEREPGSGGRPGPRAAVILQDYGLLPWKTVSANVELPLLLAGTRARERRERAAPIIAELGLGEFARFFPARLSGGMRQRVALARALVQEPELLLMDEPFSSLDALTRESMQETLLELQRRRGTTVLLVTHSIEEAAYLADAVYVMRGRNPGRIVALVRAPDPAGARGRRPSFRTEPGFLEYMNRIRAALEGAA
jgi:ABC-type nitrate/sulfonate/bicarbonate transport system ATPase subunit